MTDDDTATIDRENVLRLGSAEAILHFLDTADFAPPRFEVVAGPAAC